MKNIRINELSMKFKIFYVSIPVLGLIFGILDIITRFVLDVVVCAKFPVLLLVLSILFLFLSGVINVVMLVYFNKSSIKE